MIEIVKVNKQHIPIIRELAANLWPVAFATLRTSKRRTYVWNRMYSQTSLEGQMSQGHRYAIAQHNKLNIGYVAYETDHAGLDKTKIHKLYISPKYQRHGVGKTMIDYAAQQALKANNTALFLNVNKYNTQAISFYQKHHFALIKEEEIDIGNGFIMDDYVFELTLNEAHL